MAKTSRTNRPRYREVPALKEFLKRFGTGPEAIRRRLSFAARVGANHYYLSQLGQGFRQASMEMAVAIERASYGQVRAEDLLPSEHWAYLANRLPAPPTSHQELKGKKSGSSRAGRPRKLATAAVAI